MLPLNVYGFVLPEFVLLKNYTSTSNALRRLLVSRTSLRRPLQVYKLTLITSNENLRLILFEGLGQERPPTFFRLFPSLRV